MSIRSRSLPAVLAGLAFLAASLAASAGTGSRMPPPAPRADAPQARAEAIRSFVLKWAPHVRTTYGLDIRAWAMRLVPQFAKGDPANLREALSRTTFEGAMAALDGIWARIIKCAEAGALATETRMEMELVGSVYNELPNEPLAKAVDKHLRALGGLKYSAEEQAFAEKLRQTFSLEGALALGSQQEVQPMEDGVSSGSTDVSDVSWIVPTTEFRTATYVPGTPGHSWQAVACTGSNIGRKGMLLAAKTLTLTAMDLLGDPKLIEAAKADFNKRRAGYEYRSRIPANQKPPLNYRDK